MWQPGRFSWVESHNRGLETEYASCDGNTTFIHGVRLVSGHRTGLFRRDVRPVRAIRPAKMRTVAVTPLIPVRSFFYSIRSIFPENRTMRHEPARFLVRVPCMRR